MYCIPRRDITGNRPVKSVYTFPVVASAVMTPTKIPCVRVSCFGNRSSIFCCSSKRGSKVGAIFVLLAFLRVQSMWPFNDAGDGGRYFRIFVAVKPGQVVNWLLSTARIQVDGTGLKQLWCNNFIRSTLLLVWCVVHGVGVMLIGRLELNGGTVFRQRNFP